MISKTMEEAINRQINAEFYSSYMYLSMSAYFDAKNLRGFANWMQVQANEELNHGMKFFKYLVERGGRVLMAPIEGPPQEWDSPLAAFEAVYKHEQKVTGLINNLVNQAIAEKDHASHSLLQWFIDEQVEEEASADEIVQKIRLIADSPNGLLMLDRELGKRESHND